MEMRGAGSLWGMTTPHTDNPLEATAAEWLQANRDAIAASNAWVEVNGLPLRKHWVF